jgi:hypothetical protein
LYIDGNDLGTAALPGGAQQTIQRIDIGASSDGLAPSEGYQFCGIQVFRGVKSQDQIRHLYRGGKDTGGSIVVVDPSIINFVACNNLASGRAIISTNTTSVSGVGTDSALGLIPVIRPEFISN